MKNRPKKQKNKVKYTDDKGEMDDFIDSPILTKEEERALGIPSPEEAKKMRMVYRPAKDTRINVRLDRDTLEGLKRQAAKVGMPYQTLIASALHMIANGNLQLAFFQKGAVSKRARA